MKAGKSSTSIGQIASMPSLGCSTVPTLLMQRWAKRTAALPRSNGRKAHYFCFFALRHWHNLCIAT